MARFPFLPMAVLTTCLLSAWMIEWSLSSYAGYMVLHLQVVGDPNLVGYYTGFLMSALLIGRMVSALFWGIVADRYGRRPVLFVALGCIAVFSIGFGFSTSFWAAFTFRFLVGLCNGLNTLWSTLISEICGKEHEVVGMGAITMIWSLGVLGGSGLGGVLSEPATHYPSVFSPSGVFGRFPYLLPNVVGATLALLSVPLVLCFFPETLVTASSGETARLVSVREKDNARDRDDRLQRASSARDHASLLRGNDNEIERGSRSPATAKYEKSAVGKTTAMAGRKPVKRKSLLAEAHIRVLLLIYGLFALTGGLANIFSLWALSTVPKGGLEWSTKQIGQVLLASGISVFLFESSAFPIVLGRFGIKTPQRMAAVALVPAYFSLPYLSSLQGTTYPLLVGSISVLFTIYLCCDLFLTGISLAVNNATVPERRGELNGLASTICSVSMAAGPCLWSSLFAFSMQGKGPIRPFPFDFHLTFFAMATLRLIVALLSWNICSVNEHEKRTDVVDGQGGFNAAVCSPVLERRG